MANDAVTRITSGVAQPEYIDSFLADAWFANQDQAATLHYLTDLLPTVPGAKYGPNPRISGPALQGMYKLSGSNSVEYAGEWADYNYEREGGYTLFTTYVTELHVGLEFSTQQVNYVANAVDSRVDIIEDEKREKLRQMMVFQNDVILGTNGRGTGAWLPARRTYDANGLRTILNNANNYYDQTRPATGELDSIQVTAATIAAGDAALTFADWQRQVRANGRPTPTLLICSDILMPWFIAENINPWADANRNVQMNVTAVDPAFAHNEINFTTNYGNRLMICFDKEMPGSGPGTGADNEFLLINPAMIDLLFVDGYYYNDPIFQEGDQTQPLMHWSNIFVHFWFRLRDPQCHLRAVSQTIPALT